MNKKWLVRAAVAVGVLMAALLVAAPAMAMWDWCDRDPVISIAGHTVSLDASIQGDPKQIDKMKGDMVFTVTVPKDTEISVISCDDGAQVKIVYGPKTPPHGKSSGDITVKVSLDIPAPKHTTFNSQLTVTLDGVQIIQDQGTTDIDLNDNFTISS
jgi:hypothetical protein